MRHTLITLLIACLFTLVWWPWIVRLPTGGIEDDGYFYGTIAYYAGVHGVFSFDGIHPTDGFHMLWGYLLAGGSLLLSFLTRSRIAHLYLACTISVATIALVAHRHGRRRTDKILLFGLGIMGTLLVETPLLMLLVLPMVMRAPSSAPPSASEQARHVLLALAISATRIDATIVSLVWAACLVFEGRRRLASTVAVGIILGIALQLTLNRYTAGAWISVAAGIKAQRAFDDFPRLSILLAYPGRTALLWLLLTLSLLAAWRHVRATGQRHCLFAWCALGSFTAPHLLHGMRPWYFVPGFLGCTALLINVRDEGPPSAARTARAGIAAGWLGLAAFVVNEAAVGVRYAEETRAIEDFIEDVRRIVPAGRPIFQVDGSGYTGFFTERPVVNGDGLVNTHRYTERMRAGQLAGYLDEEGIDFIISNQLNPGRPIINRGGLIVSLDELEELARKRGPPVNRYTNFRLFRRKQARFDSSERLAPLSAVADHIKMDGCAPG